MAARELQKAALVRVWAPPGGLEVWRRAGLPLAAIAPGAPTVWRRQGAAAG